MFTEPTDGLVAPLSAICREHLLGEKIVVAPSLAIGHQIADAIALGGTPWVNLRFETMRTLADRVASFDLVARGLTILSRAQALALIGRACDRALDSSSYFGALADRPGLHRAMQRTIDDVRHAGVDLSAVPPTAFEDVRKAADLSRILAAYEGELANARAVDRFGVTARAVQMLEDGAAFAASAGAIWMVLDDVELTETEQRLLQLIAGQYTVIGTAPDRAPAQPTDFRRALGEENEVRSAFRSLLADRMPFDEAEIVYSSRDPYLPLTYELSSEYGVPCTFAEGIAAHFTRPGQACLGFLEWIGGGWHAEALQKIARSGAMALATGEDAPALSPSSFARVLRHAAVGWGRQRYLTRIDGFISELEVQLETQEAETRRAALVRALTNARHTRTVLVELLEMTAEVAEAGQCGLGAVARAASAFVKRFGARINQNDVMAREAILGMLRELSDIGDQQDVPVARPEWVSRLAEAVRAVHVGASNPRPGFLHVAPIRAGGWNGRERMFVIGLDEQRHPGSGLQDPILLDAERDAVNAVSHPLALPVLRDAPARMSEQFRRLMARSASRRITLSYPASAVRDRRERFPANGLLEMYRCTVRKGATYGEVAAGATRDGFVDPQPITGAEWWLMRRFAGDSDGVARAVRDAYPGLTAGAEALAARNSDAITRFDGVVEAPVEELDPRRNGRVYSASGLETIARCPYQYFVRSVLHVEPPDELEFDADVWLAANQFGLMLHEVLQQVMDELTAATSKPTQAFLSRAEAIAEDALARWRARVPPPGHAAFQRRRTELLESCAIFLRVEEQEGEGVTPRYFEVSFGFGESSPESIAMPEPLVLPLGGGQSIRVRGRIDRVDYDAARDEWHVWDYKSGGTFEYDRGGSLQQGTKLQHALYARAVEAMLGARGRSGKVTKSGYYFPTPKGRGGRVTRACSDAELKTVLNDLCDILASGYFLHATPDRCRFCSYKDLCGGEVAAAQQAFAKITANPTHPGVQAWVDLQRAT